MGILDLYPIKCDTKEHLDLLPFGEVTESQKSMYYTEHYNLPVVFWKAHPYHSYVSHQGVDSHGEWTEAYKQIYDLAIYPEKDYKQKYPEAFI